MSETTLKTIGNLALVGAGVVISVFGVKRLVKNHPNAVKSTGDFLGSVIDGITGFVSSVLETDNLSITIGGDKPEVNSYWMNCSGDVIVKVNRYYPASDKIIYTKYSKTGKAGKVCQTYYSNFVNHYSRTYYDYKF